MAQQLAQTPMQYQGPGKWLGVFGGYGIGAILGGLAAMLVIAPIVIAMGPGALLFGAQASAVGTLAVQGIGFLSGIYGAIKGYQKAKRGQEQFQQMQSQVIAAEMIGRERSRGISQETGHAPEQTRPQYLDAIIDQGKGAASPERVEQTQGTGQGL